MTKKKGQQLWRGMSTVLGAGDSVSLQAEPCWLCEPLNLSEFSPAHAKWENCPHLLPAIAPSPSSLQQDSSKALSALASSSFSGFLFFKLILCLPRCQWLTLVILATWEAEIERIEV
jgi:hypothetical protein